MIKKFMELNIVLRVILLLPFISWFTEMILRWFEFAEKKDTGSLVIALIVTFTGYIFGLIDLILMLVTGKLLELDIK